MVVNHFITLVDKTTILHLGFRVTEACVQTPLTSPIFTEERGAVSVHSLGHLGHNGRRKSSFKVAVSEHFVSGLTLFRCLASFN